MSSCSRLTTGEDGLRLRYCSLRGDRETKFISQSLNIGKCLINLVDFISIGPNLLEMPIGHFWVTLSLCFKTGRAQPWGKSVWFAWKWTCRWNTFPYEKFCMKTGFDTDAQGNSEVAYCRKRSYWIDLHCVFRISGLIHLQDLFSALSP